LPVHLTAHMLNFVPKMHLRYQGSRSREAVSSLKDEEAKLLCQGTIFSGRENSLKPRYVPVVADQTTGFDHVEHHQRPDLLFHNYAEL